MRALETLGGATPAVRRRGRGLSKERLRCLDPRFKLIVGGEGEEGPMGIDPTMAGELGYDRATATGERLSKRPRRPLEKRREEKDISGAVDVWKLCSGGRRDKLELLS